jgi:tetratricopeptide (TPR) repeat protein
VDLAIAIVGNKAGVLIALGRAEEAVDLCAEEIEKYDEEEFTEEILPLRARILVQLARLDEALTAYEQVIAGDPSERRHYFDTACVLARLGRGREAIELLDEHEEELADELDLRYPRAQVLVLAGEAEEALRLVRAVPGNHNDDPLWWRCYLDCLVALGRHDEAVAEIDRLLALHPGWREAVLQRHATELEYHPRWHVLTTTGS